MRPTQRLVYHVRVPYPSHGCDLHVPLVVRLEGTNVDLGKKIIAESKLNVTSGDDLDDAAQKIVKLVA